MKKIKELNIHGELSIVEVEELPNEAKKIELKEDYVLAPSETTGNDHMLSAAGGVELFSFNEDFYVKTLEPTKIYCKLPNRHTDLNLRGKTVYKINKQKEYDHFRQEVRNIAD